MKLPRLGVNWLKQDELFRRYWDLLTTTVEGSLITSYTVSSLPSGTVGDRATVTDASASTFYSIVSGGGAMVVPVFYDGSNWRVG